MALLIYHADRLLRLLLTLFLLLPSLTCAGAATEAADSNIEPYGESTESLHLEHNDVHRR